MSDTPPPPVTEQWNSAIETVKALAEAPDAVDAGSRTAALTFIWSASLGNRDRANLPELQDLPPDTRQLLHQADNAQLAEHIARAATKAVVALGKQIKQAASAPATSSSTASNQQDAEAAVPRVTKAVVLPAVQLLTTYAAVQRAWLNHPEFTRDMFGTMAIQVMALPPENFDKWLKAMRCIIPRLRNWYPKSLRFLLSAVATLQVMVNHQLQDTGAPTCSFSKQAQLCDKIVQQILCACNNNPFLHFIYFLYNSTLDQLRL
jgi:hypothetical protein